MNYITYFTWLPDFYFHLIFLSFSFHTAFIFTKPSKAMRSNGKKGVQLGGKESKPHLSREME